MLTLRWGFWGVALLLAAAVTGLTQNTMDEELTVIKKVPTTQKVVALTIDDGPYEPTTSEVLAVLRQKQVKATFFVLGKNAEKHPALLAQAVADGHEIASHAYSHKFLNRMSQAEYRQELEQAERIITAVAPKPALFRPPGGGYNDAIVAEARRRGYTTVLWSVDPRDWQRLSVEQVVNNVMNNVQPGSIVLLHDGQYPLPTPQAIGIIIDRLRADGYTVVTVSDMLRHYATWR